MRCATGGWSIASGPTREGGVRWPTRTRRKVLVVDLVGVLHEAGGLRCDDVGGVVLVVVHVPHQGAVLVQVVVVAVVEAADRQGAEPAAARCCGVPLRPSGGQVTPLLLVTVQVLAGQHRPTTGSLQGDRERACLVAVTLEGFDSAAHAAVRENARVVAVAAGEDRRTGGATHRGRGECLCESPAPIRDQRPCLGHRVPVGRDHRAEVVDEEQDDVRTLGGLRDCRVHDRACGLVASLYRYGGDEHGDDDRHDQGAATTSPIPLSWHLAPSSHHDQCYTRTGSDSCRGDRACGVVARARIRRRYRASLRAARAW